MSSEKDRICELAGVTEGKSHGNEDGYKIKKLKTEIVKGFSGFNVNKRKIKGFEKAMDKALDKFLDAHYDAINMDRSGWEEI